jgi:hypothetical protein
MPFSGCRGWRFSDFNLTLQRGQVNIRFHQPPHSSLHRGLSIVYLKACYLFMRKKLHWVHLWASIAYPMWSERGRPSPTLKFPEIVLMTMAIVHESDVLAPQTGQHVPAERKVSSPLCPHIRLPRNTVGRGPVLRFQTTPHFFLLSRHIPWLLSLVSPGGEHTLLVYCCFLNIVWNVWQSKHSMSKGVDEWVWTNVWRRLLFKYYTKLHTEHWIVLM